MFLHTVVKNKDHKFEQMMDILMKTLNQQQMKIINNKLHKEW